MFGKAVVLHPREQRYVMKYARNTKLASAVSRTWTLKHDVSSSNGLGFGEQAVLQTHHHDSSGGQRFAKCAAQLSGKSRRP